MTGESRRDESVNFSLKELLRIEDERLEQQRREQEAHEAAELRARDEAQRRERDRLDAKARADEEERALEQRRELEELAKREAMQKAIVEQARLEVEVRARTEERERERRHELELAKLRTDVRVERPRSAWVAVASGFAGAVLASSVAVVSYFAIVAPAAEAKQVSLARDVASAETRAGELDRRVDEQKRVIAELQAKLDVTVAAAALKPASPPAKVPSPTKAPAVVPPPAAKANEPPCDPHDPLACGRIK